MLRAYGQFRHQTMGLHMTSHGNALETYHATFPVFWKGGRVGRYEEQALFVEGMHMTDTDMSTS